MYNLCTKQGNSSKKSAVYNQEWLILGTIYVVNKEILQKNPRFVIKSGFKSRAGYNGACTVVISGTLTRFLDIIVK